MHCPILPASVAALLLLLPWTAAGQDAPASVRSDVLLGPRSGTGLHRYVPGRWNLLHLRLLNRQDAAVTLQSTAFPADDATLQFGRSVWLPPHSTLETTYPIWLPQPTDLRQEAIDLRTRTIATGGNSDVLVRDQWGKLEGSDLLRLTKPLAVTGIIRPLDNPPAEREYDQVLELIQVCRQAVQLPLPVHELGNAFLPASDLGYQALDQLVVADGRVARDDAAVAALQAWLSAGRNMWVMLDQLAAADVERLLGQTVSIAEVDRVGLTSLTMQWTESNDTAASASAEFEQPVPFVRVFPTDAEVICTIDGWPAAFWLNYGAGRILVTTLGARGWIERRPESPPNLFGPARTVTPVFFTAAPEGRPLPKALDPVVQEYVGYEIPARGLITALLGGFAALLTVIAVGLWRIGRLEQLGLYGPALGLLIAGGLVGIGLRQRQAAPPIAAQLQVAEVVPGGEVVRIRGTAGVYRPESRPATWEGEHGGRLQPDLSGTGGSTRQLLWSDLDRWRWENLQHPAGLRLAEFEVTQRLPAPLRATATCGPQGLVGKLELPEGIRPEDVVVVTADGRLGATLAADGSFAADPAAVFGPNQFVSAELLSDEQRRRSHILELLLTDASWRDFPPTPQLLFWTSPLDAGLRFGPDLQELGTTLLIAPLDLTRPAERTAMTIPSPLISYREERGPDGALPQGLYDYRTRQWQERSGPASNWLQCRPPRELAPLQLERVQVVIRVTGPVGRLELAGWRDGQRVVLQTWNAPVGTLSTELRDVSAIPVAPDGSFLLQVAAGEPSAPQSTKDTGREQREYWRIESLALTVHAATLAASTESPASSTAAR